MNLNTKAQQVRQNNEDPVNVFDSIEISLNLESTRYIGPGSLLMMSDGGKEQIIPQMQNDLSSVEPYLKVLPPPIIAESYIDVYFEVGVY